MSLENGTPQMGVGLRGMQERLRSLGGRLQIQSNERGTKIVAIIPLGPNNSLVENQVSIKADSASIVRG
jgi:signal transduction histidine kinase